MYYQQKQYAELDNFMASTYKGQNRIEEHSADREQAEENVQKVEIAKGNEDHRAKDTSSLEKLQLEIYTAIEQENIEALYTLTAGIALLPLKERTLLMSSIKKRTSNLKSDCTFSWSAFKQMIEREVKAHQAYEITKFRKDITPYEKTSYGMIRHTEKRNTVLISNFTAEIVADRVRDDGAVRTRSYAITAELLDRSYHFEVPAEDFAECKWVDTYMGARACITVGSSMKWHLISSIKYCSDPQEQFYYAHTGWRKIDGSMVYLHNDGCLGQVRDDHLQDLTQACFFDVSAWEASLEREQPSMGRVGQVGQVIREASVQLTGSLSHCQFPPEREHLQQAIRASLRFMDLTDDTITMPLYAALWRSILGKVNFGMHVAGRTGMGKSEIAALIQQHFGAAMDASNLPGSWESTENSLEMLLFQAKDMLIVIDDFKPKGSKNDQERIHAKADRIFRSIGNGSARARLNGDLQQRTERRPRCMILSTGEDVPKGESLKSRAIILIMDKSITKGAASQTLNAAQNDAKNGIYAQAMAGYIEWLAPRIEIIQAQLPSLVVEVRDRFHCDGHARSNANTANLILGMRCFLQYACELGAITLQAASSYLERCKIALTEIASEAAYENMQDKPTEQWRRLLIAAITSKNAHLATSDDGNPGLEYGWVKRIRMIEREDGAYSEESFSGGGDKIGWIDGDNIYLNPECAYKVANDMGSRIGMSITISEQMLRKLLVQDNMLASTGLDSLRKTIAIRKRLRNDFRPEVLHIKKALLFPHAISTDSDDPPDPERSKSASEEPSGVGQVVGPHGPWSSGDSDPHADQAPQFNPGDLPGEDSEDYDVFNT